MSCRGRIAVILPLGASALCLFGETINRHWGDFNEFQALLLSVQWMLLASLTVWCGVLLFLTFSRKDWLLVILLLGALSVYSIGSTVYWRVADAVILSLGVTLGRGVSCLLKGNVRKNGGNNPETINQQPATWNFLVGLAGLLAFASWWHLDASNNSYHGPRWMGLWNNPNEYGMLMGAGLMLTIGLLAERLKESEKRKAEREKQGMEDGQLAESGRRSFFTAIKSAMSDWRSAFFLVAVFLMGVGLMMSYSRGAWVATVVALPYLAWRYGKLKWRLVLPVILVTATAVVLFWHSTADTDAWYLKRLDLSRPSAQHRVSAWRGALQMMRNHPLGVGWNQAVSVYDQHYSSPEGGAAALTMNSYLMLGTELGVPGLLCFVAYVGLCLRGKCRIENAECRIKTACRAGALVFVVGFWFDGGLFDLPTAAMFWVLLELGATQLHSEAPKMPTNLARN